LTTDSQHAYRASDALVKAIRAYKTACDDFQRDVVQPWEDSQPDVNTLWARFDGLDTICVGFGSPDVPPGLSSNQRRRALLPQRGKAGDYWRNTLRTMRQRPKLSDVLRAHEVRPHIPRTDLGRWFTPGMLDTGDATYFTWGVEHPNPGPHLTLVRLSEYYLAREAFEDRQGKLVDPLAPW
jgi:hypothetical protein